MVAMTPKEAIERLERLQEPEPWETQIDSETWTALQMGIDAVKTLAALKEAVDGLKGLNL